MGMINRADSVPHEVCPWTHGAKTLAKGTGTLETVTCREVTLRSREEEEKK